MIDKRTHVLFLIPSLRGGGAERVITTILRYLDRSRFKLSLAVLDARGAVYRDDLPEDIEFIDLHCRRVRYALFPIIRLIWKTRPDSVFSTLGHLNLALAIIRILLPGHIRYIARETTILSQLMQDSPWWRRAYRKFYPRFDTIVCQSRHMRDDLVLNFGVSVEKTIVINNPVDVDRIRGLARESVDTGMEKKWGNADRRPQVNLVAAGRMKFEKGLDLLIEALALCCNPSLHLTLLGEGPLLHDLKALAILKGVGEQVRFVGFQKNPYPFLSQADFFVLSSRSEGFPNVVLEAMACGTPIIATPLDVMKEMLKDVRGCVIADEATAAGLARAMQSLASGRRLPMDVVETYSAPNIVSQYAQVLNGIR